MLFIFLVVLLVLALGGGGWGYSRYGYVGWSPAGLIVLVARGPLALSAPCTVDGGHLRQALHARRGRPLPPLHVVPGRRVPSFATKVWTALLDVRPPELGHVETEDGCGEGGPRRFVAAIPNSLILRRPPVRAGGARPCGPPPRFDGVAAGGARGGVHRGHLRRRDAPAHREDHDHVAARLRRRAGRAAPPSRRFRGWTPRRVVKSAGRRCADRRRTRRRTGRAGVATGARSSFQRSAFMRPAWKTPSTETVPAPALKSGSRLTSNCAALQAVSAPVRTIREPEPGWRGMGMLVRCSSGLFKGSAGARGVGPLAAHRGRVLRQPRPGLRCGGLVPVRLGHREHALPDAPRLRGPPREVQRHGELVVRAVVASEPARSPSRGGGSRPPRRALGRASQRAAAISPLGALCPDLSEARADVGDRCWCRRGPPPPSAPRPTRRARLLGAARRRRAPCRAGSARRSAPGSARGSLPEDRGRARRVTPQAERDEPLPPSARPRPRPGRGGRSRPVSRA